MDKIKIAVSQAKNFFNTADHLAYVTYPALRETKLLLSIAENLYLSMVKAMESVLQYDRMYRRIRPLPDNFDSRFEVFKNKCAPRYSIDRDFVVLLDDLRGVLTQHKESPVEFTRRDRLVICDANYQMQTLSIEKMRSYLTRARPLLIKITKVVDNNA